MPLPVILIFDIGKTNKKLLLFDKQYQLVYEEAKELNETTDEEGFPCEDVVVLTSWIKESYKKIIADKRFQVVAANASAYGASFVHLNSDQQPFLSICNYMKPYDLDLQKQFYNKYGGEKNIAEETASPVLGNLNSGMQLYWMKHKNPELYSQIFYSLHLPQYISFLLCGCLSSDITSIGCHTGLWDFRKHDYHAWVYHEGIYKKLAPVTACDGAIGNTEDNISVGSGLHDSSAALIPYMASYNEPFILLSTGTWNISLNPFNHLPLTAEELQNDCLSYLSYEGNAVKAARLFAGYEHEQQVKKMAVHYHTKQDDFKTVRFDAEICNKLQSNQPYTEQTSQAACHFYDFETYEMAYHRLMIDIVKQQISSINLVIKNSPVKKIFVDGGFSKNEVFMNLLASAFPHLEVYAAVVAQASALGAAIAISKAWNDVPLQQNFITTKRYEPVYTLSRNDTSL